MIDWLIDWLYQILIWLFIWCMSFPITFYTYLFSIKNYMYFAVRNNPFFLISEAFRKYPHWPRQVGINQYDTQTIRIETFRGWSGDAMALGKLPVPGRPTIDSRARAYCACSRCGWGLFGHFYSPLSFLSSFSFSLGDGPIKTEILSPRAV